jgi:tetratricopeptide (TPR) repeat protein
MPENPSPDPRRTVDHIPAPEATATVDDTGASRPPGATVPYLPAPPADAPRIPGYRITAEIGHGGMGRVHAGHDLTLDREVALKTLLPGADAGRFVVEAKITARLPHPGIPPVHALGTLADGTPYLAMKLIRGRTLADLLKERPSPLHELPRFVQIFEQIAQAVGFAHAQGVLHRDLKPLNVMVGAFGEVQVMDWGLAKDLASGERERPEALPEAETGTHTAAGAILGTPGYQAPEQARGEAVGARADVFALGATLAEILTGRPAFSGTSRAEVVARAARGDLAEVRQRLTGSGADQELIALALLCLSADVAGRPVDGRAVAALVAAYRAGVEARLKQAETERAEALVREAERRKRRRTVRVAGGVIALVLLAGLSVSLWQMVRAMDAEGQAKLGWGQAETQHKRADANFAVAREVILELGNRINQIETGLKSPIAVDEIRYAALEKAREQFEQFRADLPDDEVVQWQAAKLDRYAANLSRLLGRYPKAEANYNTAVRIYEDLSQRFPDRSAYRDELAQTLGDRAALEKRMGKLTDAAATLGRAVQVTEALEGKLPASSYRRTLGVVVDNQTDVAYLLGQFDAAARYARRSGELFEQLKTAPVAERNPVDPLFAAMTVHRLALAQRELGQTAAALVSHDDAVARMKALGGPQANRDVRFWDCEVRRERARTAALFPERRTAAAADLAEVIQGMEQLVGENPDLALYRERLAAAYLCHGELLTLLGQPDAAIAPLTKSLTISRELVVRFGNLSGSVLVRGQTFLALGRARAAAGKYDEATAEWTKARKVFEAGLKIDPDNAHQRRGRGDAEQALRPPAK